jgi:Flp pilus assembly protein TadD
MNQTKSDKYPVFEALVLISSIWPVVAVGTTGLCFLLDSFFGLLTMRSVAGWIVGSGMLFVIIGWPMYMIFERVTDEIPSDLRLVTNGKSKDFSLSHNIVPVGVAAFFGIHLIWVDPFPDQRPFNGMGPYEVSWGNAFEFGCAVSVFGLLLIGGFEMWRKESMREEYGGVYREFRRSWRVVRRCIYCVPILIVAFNAAVYEIRSGSRDESNLAYRQGLDHLDDPWAKETLEHFEKAIQHNPVSPEPYLGRGMIHFWHDDLGAAKADFRTAIRLTPVNPFIVGQAGICLQRCGALDESLSAYSQAIDCISNGSEFWGESTSEQHVILLLCRCNLLVILSRFEEAINDVESMIALDPPNEYFYLIEKSRIRFLGGDHKQIDQLDDFFDRTTKRLNADPIKGSASYSAAVILPRLAKLNKQLSV